MSFFAREARQLKALKARNTIAQGNALGSHAPQMISPTLDGSASMLFTTCESPACTGRLRYSINSVVELVLGNRSRALSRKLLLILSHFLLQVLREFFRG